MPFTCNAAIVNKAYDVLASSGRFNLQPAETMYQLVGDDVNIRRIILQYLIYIVNATFDG